MRADADVVVVGSGAAGLTAALAAAHAGADVVLLERSDHVGGTTGISGGGVWAPCNPHMHAIGLEDSRAEAMQYVEGLTAGREPSRALLEAYPDAVLEAIGFLEGSTPLRFVVAERFSDYFGERPGAKLSGRTLDPAPFDARAALGVWDDRLRESPHLHRVTLDETAGPGGAAGAAGAEIGEELLRRSGERRRSGIRTMGSALVAALLRGVLDRGIPVELGVRATGLVTDGGRVTGVACADGRTVAAPRGVILASGGFEWNDDLVRAFMGVERLRPLSPPANEGDGLVMALGAGAAVANMDAAWSFPVAYDERSTFEGRPVHLMSTPRMEQGCITVNALGRRFFNEGAAYMDIGRLHRHRDPVTQAYPNASPAWMIFDATVRERVTLADLAPDAPAPPWVREGDTLEALAAAIGVDPAGLAGEVARWNRHVAAGADPDFGRGTAWFEGFTSGGPDPRRALGAITRPPFCAIGLYDGALGTAGGALIDPDGRVQAMRGGAIPGLYAAGNAAASVFGPAYPAGGATIGPAIAFGHRAGRHAADA